MMIPEAIALIATGGLLVPLWGQSMKLHLVTPSTTGVSLEAFDRAALGTKLGTQFRPETVMLVNNSDRTIVAANILWSSVNPSGKTKGYVVHVDTFASPATMKPVPVGNSRTVIGPGLLMPESGSGFKGSVGPVRTSPFSWSGDTTVTLDAVMFEDGEVVGPDTLNLLEETEAKQTALNLVKARVRSAGGTRQTLQSMLTPATPVNRQEVRVANAVRDLVQRGLELVPEAGHGPQLPPGKQMATVEMWLNALPAIPKPFRKSQQ